MAFLDKIFRKKNTNVVGGEIARASTLAVLPEDIYE